MAVTSGYGLTTLSGTVTLNLEISQGRLQTDVSRLSSGLRINTAADGPSGLAIAEALQSKVNGYDQAVGNVQDATNAATVADGALQTTTDLLQRVRTLAVGAASDVLSPSDRTNIQTEICQLLHEVNQISQNTNFNGVPLLDGTYSGSTPQKPATIAVVSNAALASACVPPKLDLVSNPNFSLPLVSAGSFSVVNLATVSGWYYYTAGGGSSGVYNSAATVYGYPAPASPDGQQAAYLNPAPNASAAVETYVNLIAGHTYTINIDAAASTAASLWQITFNGTNGGGSNLTNGFQAITGGFAAHSFQMTATSTGHGNWV